MSEQGKAPGPRVGAGAPAPRPTAPPPGPVATTKTKRRSGPKSKSSPFIGVTQYKRTGNWEAHIWIQGSPKAKGFQRHLGSYETAEEAARCYDRAALKLRGDAAELNYSRAEYEQDEFLVEHAKTDKFRFLDALRARFSIQTPARPAAPAPAPRPRPHRTTQQRGRRQESEDEDWDVRQPDSPRYRTVHRVPRPLAAPALAAPPPGPQRVTVVPQLPPSLRLDPLLPMPGPGRPGSGSMGMGMGSMGGLPSPGDQSPLGGSAAGRAKGLLLRQPSTGPAVSEELLITTAPLGSAGMHVHETLVWPFAQAAQPGLSQPAGVGGGADVGSGGPTPCSSPGLRLVPPIFELSPLQQAQQVQQAHQAQQTQQVQHGGCTSSGCTSSDGTLPAAPPGSPRSMGVSPGGYLGAGVGLGPALLPSGLPASALLLQGGRLGALHAGLPGPSPLGSLPSLAFDPLMLPRLGLGLSLPATAPSAGAVATPAAGGGAGDRLAAGGDGRGASGKLQDRAVTPVAMRHAAAAAAAPGSVHASGSVHPVGGVHYGSITGDQGRTAAAAAAGAATQANPSERLSHGWDPSPAPSPRDCQQGWLVPAGAAPHQSHGPAGSAELQHWP